MRSTPRKSSEEGLEQEFNSLQAQREACEAFITSQRHEGWVCLRAAYDDGGFSGATMAYRARDRKLIIVDSEAEIVRFIYRRYAELGSVRLLKDELEARSIRSKLRTSASAASRVGNHSPVVRST